MSALDCRASKQALPQTPRWATREVCSGLAHRVYGLFDCPELEACTFVFSRRTPFDDHDILLAGDLDDEAPSLNLATLRHLGANLGVRLGDVEVHIFQEATASRMVPTQASRAKRSGRFQSISLNTPHLMH